MIMAFEPISANLLATVSAGYCIEWPSFCISKKNSINSGGSIV